MTSLQPPCAWRIETQKAELPSIWAEQASRGTRVKQLCPHVWAVHQPGKNQCEVLVPPRRQGGYCKESGVRFREHPACSGELAGELAACCSGQQSQAGGSWASVRISSPA